MAKTIIYLNQEVPGYKGTTLKLPHTQEERYIVKFERGFAVIQSQVYIKSSSITDIKGNKEQAKDEWVDKRISFINSNCIDRIVLDNEINN